VSKRRLRVTNAASVTESSHFRCTTKTAAAAPSWSLCSICPYFRIGTATNRGIGTGLKCPSSEGLRRFDVSPLLTCRCLSAIVISLANSASRAAK